MSTKYIGIDIETWTFEIEKVEFLLSLCDGSRDTDQVWALTTAATALCEKLRGTMDTMCADLAAERPFVEAVDRLVDTVPHRRAA